MGWPLDTHTHTHVGMRSLRGALDSVLSREGVVDRQLGGPGIRAGCTCTVARTASITGTQRALFRRAVGPTCTRAVVLVSSASAAAPSRSPSLARRPGGDEDGRRRGAWSGAPSRASTPRRCPPGSGRGRAGAVGPLTRCRGPSRPPAGTTGPAAPGHAASYAPQSRDFLSSPQLNFYFTHQSF